MELELFLDHKYVEDNDLLCGICKNVMIEPQTILAAAECQHSFCKDCLTTWRAQSNKCPICRVAIQSAFVDLKIKRQLAKLTVKCERYSAGCEATGTLGIGEKLFPTVHALQCLYFPLNCPCCDQVVLRKSMQEHELSCQMFCPFKPFGCQERFSRDKLADHLKTAEKNHLVLTLTSGKVKQFKPADVDNALKCMGVSLAEAENKEDDEKSAAFDARKLTAGDVVDVLTPNKKWEEGVVKEIKEGFIRVYVAEKKGPFGSPSRDQVHGDGEWIPIDSGRLAKLNTHTGLAVNLVPFDASMPMRQLRINTSLLKDSMLSLKEKLSIESGIPIDNLVVGEVWRGKIYKFFAPNHDLMEIKREDILFAWEVPSPEELKDDVTYCQLIPMTTQQEESNSFGTRGTELVAHPCGVPLPIPVLKSGMMRSRDLRRQIVRMISPWLINAEQAPVPYVVRALGWGGKGVKGTIADDDTLVDVNKESFGVEMVDINRFRSERLPADWMSLTNVSAGGFGNGYGGLNRS